LPQALEIVCVFSYAGIPDAGYRFVHWAEGGEVVETHFEYRFTVDSDRHLVAEFEKR